MLAPKMPLPVPDRATMTISGTQPGASAKPSKPSVVAALQAKSVLPMPRRVTKNPLTKEPDRKPLVMASSKMPR